jgi:sec-independent protein translocase protein TatC
MSRPSTRKPKLPAQIPAKLPCLPKLPDPDEPDVFEEMTLLEHMEELRDRLVKAAIAIGVAFIGGLLLARPLLALIVEHAKTRVDIIDPTDPLTIFFKIALYIAIGIAMPVIIWQMVGFLAPGMTNKEKRILFTSLPFVSLLFVAGAAYAFFVAIPRAFDFLSSFLPDLIHWDPDGSRVISFYLTLMIGLGLAFQLPVVMFLLSKLNIVSVRQLQENRRYAVLAIMALSAIITPTTDPFSLALVALPLYLLFELGVLLGRVLVRPAAASTTSRHLALIILPMYLLYRAGLWLGRPIARPRASAYDHLAIARLTDG